MERILIFVIITLAAASDMDPKCFVKPPYVNPRTCCLDPTIVKDDLHEKCMRKVFKQPRIQNTDAEYDHSEANIIPNTDDDQNNENNDNNNNDRNKRSVGELQSSLDSNSDSSGSSSSEESYERRPHKHHRNHGRNYNGRRGRNGKHRHHHGKHHHGHHHRPHHHGGNHHDRYYEMPKEYDDTYTPVFHRDFARWSANSARFQKLSIYWNCVFNETGIIDPEHKVIMPNVKSYLDQVLEEDNPFLPIMEESFNACKVKREEFLNDLKVAKEHYILDSTPLEREVFRREHPKMNLNTNQYNQQHHAYFLIRCVKRMTYKNCPDDKFRTDDKLCSKSRSYLKNCPYSARQYYQMN